MSVITPNTNYEKAKDGIAFILPLYNGFAYARRAAMSFFKYTPTELKPFLLIYDDASPLYPQQNWEYWLRDLPVETTFFYHFPSNGGLTRSWNEGLLKAREIGAKYAIAGNSDILFTPHWHEALLYHLERTVHLCGPVTNAPGFTNQQQQNVNRFFPNYQNNDDPSYLAQVAKHLKENYPAKNFCKMGINGFFTMAKTSIWWEGQFTHDLVFDPANRMTRNEDELQGRWRRRGWRIGFVPASFIYHYRAVSRGDKYRAEGWARLKDMHKDV